MIPSFCCAALFLTLSGVGFVFATISKAQDQTDTGIVWHSVLEWDVEGRAWSTDGSHPSDLGFLRQADAFEPILKQALGLN